MKSKSPIRKTARILFGAVLLFIALFPIYWLVAMSIRPTDEMKGHISVIPHSLTGTHSMRCLRKEALVPPY